MFFDFFAFNIVLYTIYLRITFYIVLYTIYLRITFSFIKIQIKALCRKSFD